MSLLWIWQLIVIVCSIADPGCLSRIMIYIHPGSGSRYNNSHKRGGKKTAVLHFCSHKYHKIVNYFIFEPITNICVWDPGSEIRDPEKIYSGSRTRGQNRIPDPQHWRVEMFLLLSSPNRNPLEKSNPCHIDVYRYSLYCKYLPGKKNSSISR